MTTWTADIASDPDRGFALIVELLEDDQYRGRVYRRGDGTLVLRLYDAPQFEVPLAWLVDLATQAEVDIK